MVQVIGSDLISAREVEQLALRIWQPAFAADRAQPAGQFSIMRAA
jgi:hypothetical protein